MQEPYASWKKEVAIALFDKILSECAGKTADELINSGRLRRNVKNVTKKDIKNIEKKFGKGTMLSKAVADFFINKVIPDSTRFYSAVSVTDKQQDELFSAFKAYWAENNKANVKLDETKDKDNLVFCLNEHNQKLRKANLTLSDELSQSITQKGFNNVESLLRQISDTLCLDTDLQISNSQLDYLTQQIESIIKTMRIDIQKSKNIVDRLMKYIIITVIFAVVSVCLTFKYADAKIALIEAVFFLIILTIIFVPIYPELKGTKEKEKLLNGICINLFCLHYEIYKIFLNEKVLKSDDKTSTKEDMQ